METERNWVGAVKHDFAMQFYSNIQMKFWEANPLVLIKIGLIKINQKFEKNLPIVNSLPDENVEYEYIHVFSNIVMVLLKVYKQIQIWEVFVKHREQP